MKSSVKTTNNQVELEALTVGLKLTKKVRAWSIKVMSKSQLVVAQVQGEFKIKEPKLAK